MMRKRRLGMEIGMSVGEDGEKLTGDASEATRGNCDAPLSGGRIVERIARITVLKLDLQKR